jgi:hypothetical protein
VDPRKFLDLAQLLAAGTPQPERLRTATSRAYYAVYNFACQILDEMGFRVSTGPGGHGEVRNRLNYSKDAGLQNISSQLGDLQGNRITADYRMSKAIAENPQTVKTHVEQAKKMIETMERSCLGPGRSKIIEAIKEGDQLVKGGGQITN